MKKKKLIKHLRRQVASLQSNNESLYKSICRRVAGDETAFRYIPIFSYELLMAANPAEEAH